MPAASSAMLASSSECDGPQLHLCGGENLPGERVDGGDVQARGTALACRSVPQRAVEVLGEAAVVYVATSTRARPVAASTSCWARNRARWISTTVLPVPAPPVIFAGPL